MITQEQYEDAIRNGSGIPICKIEFLRLEDESVKEDETIISEIIGGGISGTGKNGVRRTVNVVLVNPDGIFNPKTEGRVDINSKFIIYLGLSILNDITDVWENKFISQGMFVSSNSTITPQDGMSLSFEGADKFSLYDGTSGGFLQGRYRIDVNTNINLAMRGLLSVKLDVNDTIPRDSQTPYLQPSAEETPYEIIVQLGGSLSDVMDELATQSARDMYYDKAGIFKFHDDVPNYEKASKWHFEEGDKSLINITKNQNARNVYNKVIVKGTNVNGTGVYGIAVNNDIKSSTSVKKIGLKPMKPIESSSIKTEAQAIAYAKYILTRVTSRQNSVTIECVPIYHLSEDDVIDVTFKSMDLNESDFVILDYNLSLIPEDNMKIVAVDTKEIILLS